MAKPVKLGKGKEFTFKQAAPGAVQSKYPWDEWFSGSLLMLERSDVISGDKGKGEAEYILNPEGEKRDYEVTTDAMVPKIKTAARRRYKVCQVSRFDADGVKLVDALIIKARDMDTSERQAEDLLRAEERAARKDAKEDTKEEETTQPATDAPQS